MEMIFRTEGDPISDFDIWFECLHCGHKWTHERQVFDDGDVECPYMFKSQSEPLELDAAHAERINIRIFEVDK